MRFSIGYNHDPMLLEMLDFYKDHVHELYFPVPATFMGSGRALHQKNDYEKEILEIIRKCRRLGIKTNILLNATCEGKATGQKEHMDKVINYLKGLDIDSITVVNPVYIERIKKEIPRLKIHASVNCYTKTLEHAQFLKDLGCDVLTVDRDINRDIELIKKIKQRTGTEIKVILNEGCLRNCPFRKSHFSLISHGSDSAYFDQLSCISILKKHPEKVFSIPFIRPEDVKHYKGFTDYFKLATRTKDTITIKVILDSYLKESYKGDLLFLLSTKGLFLYFNEIKNEVLTENNFYEKLWNCDNNCEECGYCNELLKKAASVNKEFE